MIMSDSEKNTHLANMITPYSISVYGNSVGHSNVTENALIALSYHITYKLYEILKECKTEMNVYRQTTLSSTILNNVLQNDGVPALYGNKVLIPYISIPNSDMSVLHLSKIDLLAKAASDPINVELEPIPFIKGLYVSPLSKIHGVSNILKSLKNECLKTEPKLEISNGRSENVIHSDNCVQFINQTETDYFLVISQIILNSSESLLKIVLEDLRTNPRLGAVYYSLLNLIVNSIKYFKCVGSLIDRLLRAIDALLDNQHIDPSPSYSVDEAVHALCTLILEPKIANDCDDFHYRRRASYLLMRAFNVWNVNVEQKKKLLSTLNSTLMSPEKMSLKLNYRILLMFCGLGCEILDMFFWPNLNKYLNVLASLDEIISGKRSILLCTDICNVRSALLLVSGILYRNFWTLDHQRQELHILADKFLYSYFGESILPVRMYAIRQQCPLFAATPKKTPQNDDPVVDVRKNYCKMQLSAFLKKYPAMNVHGKPSRQRFTCSDVFETLLLSVNKSIVFNFIGSNQRSYEQLKIKKPDQRYNVHCRQSLKPFLKYEKTTRCIKYCKVRKSCAGDMYLFI